MKNMDDKPVKDKPVRELINELSVKIDDSKKKRDTMNEIITLIDNEIENLSEEIGKMERTRRRLERFGKC